MIRIILDDWFKANQLSVNPAKTKYILFSRRDTASEHDLDLLIDDEKLERVHCTKFLGCSLMNTLYGIIILNTVRRKYPEEYMQSICQNTCYHKDI